MAATVHLPHVTCAALQQSTVALTLAGVGHFAWQQLRGAMDPQHFHQRQRTFHGGVRPRSVHCLRHHCFTAVPPLVTGGGRRLRNGNATVHRHSLAEVAAGSMARQVGSAQRGGVQPPTAGELQQTALASGAVRARQAVAPAKARVEAILAQGALNSGGNGRKGPCGAQGTGRRGGLR